MGIFDAGREKQFLFWGDCFKFSRMQTNGKIAVLGAGSFGTAMANLLAREGRDVLLWGRDESVVREINHRHSNKTFLKTKTRFCVFATTNLEAALAEADVVVFAVPCQSLRGFLKLCRPVLPPRALLVNLAKGVELKTFLRPSCIFADVLGAGIKNRYAILSGPTFALELCQAMPSAAVVAAQKQAVAKRLQVVLSTDWFRLYSSTDVTGVELGGALKNVMAIAVGIADGLGFGLNTRAGLITRCLAEMKRIGERLGADPATFSGLSGIGDLILTCTGELSRNRQVGVRLGRGETLSQIRKSTRHVAEGIPTAKAVHQMCRKLHLDAPNTEHVYKIIYRGLSPRKAVTQLMRRELKGEF